MFKVKKLSIDALHDLVVVLNKSDAEELGLVSKDRVEVCVSGTDKCLVCELQIFDCDNFCNITLAKGEAGLFLASFEKLDVSIKDRITLQPAPTPLSVKYIEKKFKGEKLGSLEIEQIIKDITENRLSEIEITYFVLAGTSHQFDDDETIALTNAMVKVGKKLDFTDAKNSVVVDKHCIGGIPNNRTTMIVVPIIAAAGLKIPKTSSRSITSPAGTADTMEALANVNLSLDEMYHVVNEVGGCIVWGGSLALSPADDIIIHVERPLNIDSEGQMIASILSKKKSAGSTHVLIDIPVGDTAKVTSKEHANRLKRRFEKVGTAIGLEIEVIITDGSAPIGNGVGPVLEARDVLQILQTPNESSEELRDKALLMAGKLLEMAGVASYHKGVDMASEILYSGLAWKKFEEILNAQGRKELILAKYKEDISFKNSGTLISIDNKKISKLAFMLGAPEISSAGLVLKKTVGDVVKRGDIFCEFHSNSELKLKYAKEFLLKNLPFELE